MSIYATEKNFVFSTREGRPRFEITSRTVMMPKDRALEAMGSAGLPSAASLASTGRALLLSPTGGPPFRVFWSLVVGI